MAKRSRGTAEELDDIELLNVHRYPEGAPASLVAQVRSSRSAQKRLEELLRQLPARRRGQRYAPQETPLPEGPAPEDNPDEQAGAPWARLKRFLLGG